MTKVIDYLLDPETVIVFDIDGVLAVYEFGDLCHSACPDEDWKTYVLKNDPYKSIPAVPQIQDLLRRKGTERVYACSVAGDYEEPGKRAFVERNYQIPGDHLRIVSDKTQKIAYLAELRDKLQVPEKRIALVEDTLKTLDLAMEAGDYVTVHISSLMLYNPLDS